MGKEELIEMQGRVHEVLPDSRIRVTLDNGHSLICYSGGKMRKHRIRVLARDRDRVSVGPPGRRCFKRPPSLAVGPPTRASTRSRSRRSSRSGAR
ncbi:MAG: translation initiation factor IF-1 [Proteobacteria bacterium]|nr:translation initiation factor IF-1 [Pseudomonadota bacterium]